MEIAQAKQEAARAAVLELPERGVLGLGSGSTAKLFIDEVGKLVRQGRLFSGVPTSEGSRAQAAALGIPLLSNEGPWSIDVCIDGADEVSDALDLIKGGGGAHAREKIVNASAKRNVIIVDSTKRSAKLGEKWPVPVEVLAFGHKSTAARLESFGQPKLRMRAGAIFKTDSGNFIYDVHTGPIPSPRELERALRAVVGVVEVGLFCGRADLVLVAGPRGVERLQPSR